MKKAIFTFSILFFAMMLTAQTPVAHYPLDGNGNDVSGNGLNGTVVGSVTTVADRFGNANGAMQFNGTTNSRIIVSDNSLLRPASITISAWVNILSPNGLSTFVSKPIGTCINDSWHSGTQGSSFSTWLSRSFGCGDFSQITSPLITNAWTFIVFTMDEASDIQRLYVNGVEVATGSFTGSIPYDTNPVILGGAIENGNPDFPFNGILDDVKIYNTAISASQIANEFTNGLPEENYRTVSSGTWDNALIWEKFNGTTWVSVSLAPRFTDGMITIRQNHVVTVTDSRSADQITVETGGTLNIQSNIFNLSDGNGTDLDVSGTLTLGAQLAGSGSVVISAGGQLNWQGGTLNAGGGSVTIETGATGTCTGDNWINQGRLFTNNGILALNNGRLISGDGGTFVNNGIINIASGGHIITGCTGCPGLTFTNSSTGVINKNGNDGIEWGNSENITVNNNGTVNINAGTISLRGKGAHSGSFNIPTGSILNFAGFSEAYINQFNAGSSITGAGNVNFTGGVPRFESGSSYSPALLTVHNGAYVYWNMADVTINNFTFSSGRCLGTTNFTLPGQFTWTGGEWRNTGTTSFTNTATVTFNGHLATFTGSKFINNTIINWLSGRITSGDGGTFTNNASINIAAEGHILTGCTGCPGLTFTNSSTGIINKNGNDYTEWGNSENITFNNNGVVNINAGTISLRGKGAHSGTFNIPAGSILNFAGYSGAYINQFNAGGAIAGTGNVNFDGGVPVFEPGSNYAATLVTVHNSAYVYWNANDISINNYTFNSGRYYGSGNTIFPGTFTWNGGEWLGSGSSTMTNTATMFISNNDKILGESRHLINNGNITWSGGNILSCGGGYFTNNNLVTITNNNGFYTQCTGQTVLTIQNNGTIEKTSNGTSGINTYSPFNNTGFIKGIGTYHLDNVNFTQNGTIAPGNPIGQLAFNGSQPLTSGSTLQIELQNGSGAGTGHDQLTRNGNLTLAGTLNVVETGSVPNGTYRIIELSSGNISGSFATINLPANYTLQMNANSVDVIKAVTCNNPQPVVTAGGPTTFCEGGNVVLTSDAISGNVWSNGETTQSITVNTTGNYSVTVTDNNLCSATSLTTTVIVNPLPAIPTVTANGALTICDGNTVTLTSSLPSGNLWNNGETTQNIEVSVTGDYTTTVTDINGCSNTSVPVTITVNTLPAVPTIAASGSTTFCEGGAVNLTSSEATGNVWSNGETTQSITVSNTGDYTVTVTNTSGCSATSVTTTITVLSNPPAPVITANGPIELCDGQTVTLTSSVATGYIWNTGASTQSITIDNTRPDIRLNVIDENGCISLPTFQMIIALAPPPFPLISGSGPTTFCTGESITLTSSIAQGNTWNTGETTQSITVNTSGNYSVTITGIGGCTTQSAIIPISVLPVPPAPSIVVNGATTFCSGGSVTLTSSEAPLGHANIWSNGFTGQSVVINNSGTYTLQYNNGCLSAASIPVTVHVIPAPPTPVITASPSTTVCRYTNVTLRSNINLPGIWTNSSTGQTYATQQYSSLLTIDPGTYTFRYTDPYSGCTSAASNAVTLQFVSPPVPVVEISTTNATICRNQPITFTATLLTPTQFTNSFFWRVYRNGSYLSLANNSPGHNAGPVFTTSALQDGDSVYCTYGYTDSCSQGFALSPNSNKIRVTVNPVPNAGTISGPTYIGTGNNATYSSNGVPGGIWSTDNNSIATVNNAGVVTPVQTGSTAVKYTAYNNFNCSSTSSKVVSVIFDPIAGPAKICLGLVNKQIFYPTTSMNGTWSISAPGQIDPNGGAIIPNSIGVYATEPGIFTLTYTLADGSSFSKTIESIFSEPLSSKPITGPANICEFVGTNQTFTYNRDLASPATGYYWSIPNGMEIVSGQGTTSISVRLNGAPLSSNNSLYIQNYPINYCTSTFSSNQFMLQRTAPQTPASIVASSNDICNAISTGAPIEYQIDKVQAATGYNWAFPAGTIVTHPNGTGVNDTLVIVVFQAGFTGGTCSVTAYNGCGSSNARSLNIPFSVPAMPSNISGPINTCAHQLPNGFSATYSVNHMSGNTYNWTLPNGVTSVTGQGSNSISFKYPNGFTSGTISVTITNGCGTSTARTLNVSTLNPGTPGVIDVIQMQSCPNRIFSYTLAARPANSAQILWTAPAGGIILSGQNTLSVLIGYHNSAVSGAVTVRGVSNCRAGSTRSSSVKLNACQPSFTGRGENNQPATDLVEPVKENFSVQLFPNPTTSSFNIKLKSSSKEQVNVRVIDMQGRQLSAFRATSYQTIQIGNELQAGVYFVEVKQGNNIKTERLVKY